MWRNMKRFLIVASVTLNLAFVGVWLSHTIFASMCGEGTPAPFAKSRKVWCPLHQELNLTDKQWEQIEPHLREFHRSAQSVCQNMNQLRLEMVELVAVSTPDLEAIAAKQEQIQVEHRKMQGMVIDHLLAEKEILTPDQEDRLFTIIREQSGCDRNGPMTIPGRPSGGIGRMLRDESTSQ